MFRILASSLLFSALLPAQDGWKDIFNGKDLTGWSGDPRLWRVEDGVLIGETNDSDQKIGANSFLIWGGGEPADFEFEYKARVTGKNNSGIQYRSRVINPEKWSVGGYQMDLHPNQPYLGMLYEEQGRGIACLRGQKVNLADKPAETGKLEVPAVDLAQWNSFKIVARGNVVQHFVNGQLAAEITDIHPEKAAKKGVIAIQVHAGPAMKAEFKDLRLKQANSPAQSKVIPAGRTHPNPAPRWIWKSKEPGPTEKVFFRRDYQLPENITEASITITCDNRYQASINGQDVGMGSDWNRPATYDILKFLKPGNNVFTIEGVNQGGIAAMAARIRVKAGAGRPAFMVTDGTWLCSNEAPEDWRNADSASAGWPKVVVVARMGDQPWGDVMPSPDAAPGKNPKLANSHQVAPGFKLEKLYTVPAGQGSWVSMTIDGAGRLITADQYGEIYQVALGEGPDQATTATSLGISLKGAHGLLWHEGVLWVSVNEGGNQSGVWRVTDSNGDGDPDKPELVKSFSGRGEHGPHSLVLSPDGRAIYVVAGNHTNVPEMDSSLVPKVWGEDQLLPRRPDARGHARDRMAPGGWIARFTPDGKNWQLFSVGYRNSYDAAFNEHGDLFTYDSDMEWDLGMPWYRPTRISHATPGSEFGWRNGTGKWPEYYEDSMPSQLDIGPGSPTGMVSGKGAKFPAKYQRALFALDWTFATLYAIHLTPDGAGYKAEREEFVSGKGLPLTDAAIGRDGAMYFLTGGRRTDSALWRVTYLGDESTAPVAYAHKPLSLMDPTAAKTALGGKDRVGRFNARTALENQGPDALRPIVRQASTGAWETIGAAIGLARLGDAKDMPDILTALDRLDWNSLETDQKINWLRAAGLVFIRHGKPDEAARQRVISKIDSSFPAKDDSLNRELCRMLSYLNAPTVVSRTLGLMDTAGPTPAPDWLELATRNDGYGKTVKDMIANLPPSQVIHYVYCLREVPGPWHGDERKRFFTWFNKLSGNSGGASYGGFIEDLRKQTLATCTKEELELIATFDTKAIANPLANLPSIKGPGHAWTIDDVVKLAESGLENRDKERGHDMYRASLCAACHRFGNDGGAAGPDLTSLSGRFNIRDLAEAIIEPDKVVSDQYAFDLITRTDGSQLTGKIIEEKDEKWIIATSPFDMGQTIEIERNDIKNVRPSPVSPMPPGMINRLNEEELKDLLAYLLDK